MIRPKPWWLFFTGAGVTVTLHPNIYVPASVTPSERLLAHERVHLWRQGDRGLFRWLLCYVFSRKFRLREEAIATKHELIYCENDAHRDHVVEQMAKQLAWFNYCFAAWTKDEAKRAILSAPGPMD